MQRKSRFCDSSQKMILIFCFSISVDAHGITTLIGPGVDAGTIKVQGSRGDGSEMSDDRENSALHETEEQFRLLVNSVEEYAIYMLDALGNVATWNSGAERIKQYSAREIIGKNFSCFYTAEDVAALLPARGRDRAGTDRTCSYSSNEWRLHRRYCPRRSVRWDSNTCDSGMRQQYGSGVRCARVA